MRRFYFWRHRGLTLLYCFLYTGSRISTSSISAWRHVFFSMSLPGLRSLEPGHLCLKLFLCLASIGFNEMEDLQHSQLNIDLRYSHLNFGKFQLNFAYIWQFCAKLAKKAWLWFIGFQPRPFFLRAWASGAYETNWPDNQATKAGLGNGDAARSEPAQTKRRWVDGFPKANRAKGLGGAVSKGPGSELRTGLH